MTLTFKPFYYIRVTASCQGQRIMSVLQGQSIYFFPRLLGNIHTSPMDITDLKTWVIRIKSTQKTQNFLLFCLQSEHENFIIIM